MSTVFTEYIYQFNMLHILSEHTYMDSLHNPTWQYTQLPKAIIWTLAQCDLAATMYNKLEVGDALRSTFLKSIQLHFITSP